MANLKQKIIALIVAGGNGTRLTSDIPKQYIKLKGREILNHTISAFTDNQNISDIQVVIGKGQQTLYKNAVKGLKLLPAVNGGKSRQESVLAGLVAIAKQKPDKVLIHDAARPFVSAEIINNLVEALAKEKAVLPVVPIQDTVKSVKAEKIEKTVDKSALFGAQTPQGFDFKIILAAHKKSVGQNFTDDAAVAENAGIPVSIIPGDENNFKITSRKDLERAATMIGKETRVAMGFDVHAFASQSGKSGFVTICGIKIPYIQKLEGHSDADVGLHAITDSLLGAVGAGDIGEHFPPTDKKWKNADSSLFLRHAAEIVAAKGGKINNIDLTLICEAPKMSPYREKMRENIAKILGVSLERISVKATTTEKLGFTGRCEGIAAQAIATIEV